MGPLTNYKMLSRYIILFDPFKGSSWFHRRDSQRPLKCVCWAECDPVFFTCDTPAFQWEEGKEEKGHWLEGNVINLLTCLWEVENQGYRDMPQEDTWNERTECTETTGGGRLWLPLHDPTYWMAYTTDADFSKLLRLGSPRSRCQLIRFLVRTFS